ncbi:Integrator complex subunit 11 [Saguinus oedipus]|uniref:Integrator complex subunit 11 n=1 Tax=Saguinus oedipus TaxID=9490 RepID=A0ABQ9V8B0_SAGOE|nr:Integrator complex subunit 11 [Saguinus oedipus]
MAALFIHQGDYNMTPDRHLGAAWIDKCRPNLLITESTYATTIRDSKRCRERDFLKKVHETVERGGKGAPTSDPDEALARAPIPLFSLQSVAGMGLGADVRG